MGDQVATPETPQSNLPEVRTASKPDMQLAAKGGLQLSGLDDMFRFAKYVAASGLAPKGMDAPEQILIALEMGFEVGLPPMQAIQNIAVINGRPSMWGDVMLALVRASGKMAHFKEEEIGTPYNDDYGYRVTSIRKPDIQGDEPDTIVTTFTVAKAKVAGLWKKAGPWTFYPDRMLLMRARSFNLRDNFPDVLKGIVSHEEARDMHVAEYEILDDSTPPQSKTNALLSKLAGSTDAPPALPDPPVVVVQLEQSPEPEPVTEPKPPKRESYKEKAQKMKDTPPDIPPVDDEQVPLNI